MSYVCTIYTLWSLSVNISSLCVLDTTEMTEKFTLTLTLAAVFIYFFIIFFNVVKGHRLSRASVIPLISPHKTRLDVYFRASMNRHRHVNFGDNRRNDARLPKNVGLCFPGACFIRTDQLDGETDWKLKVAVACTQRLPALGVSVFHTQQWSTLHFTTDIISIWSSRGALRPVCY